MVYFFFNSFRSYINNNFPVYKEDVGIVIDNTRVYSNMVLNSFIQSCFLSVVYKLCLCYNAFIIIGVIVRHVNIKKIDKYLICSVYLYLILFLLDINFDINHFVIAANYYNDFFVFVIYAIIGVFALMSVCKKYLYSNNIVLSFFGKNSLLVYFFCNQIIILCVKLTSPLDINWYVKSLVILVLAGLILPILVFVSNTFLPWMSGKFNYLSSYCLK